MGMSDSIAEFIHRMLIDSNGQVELRRSQLASVFNCVPSQINYVITTRFAPEYGYFVESRRGGGGYIKITKMQHGKSPAIMHAVNSIGDNIDKSTITAMLGSMQTLGVLAQEQTGLIAAATSDRALKDVPPGLRNIIRASIVKQCLMQTAGQI